MHNALAATKSDVNTLRTGLTSITNSLFNIKAEILDADSLQVGVQDNKSSMNHLAFVALIFFQGTLKDLKMNVTAIGGRVNKLERRRKDASSPGSAAAKAGINTPIISMIPSIGLLSSS